MRRSDVELQDPLEVAAERRSLSETKIFTLGAVHEHQRRVLPNLHEPPVFERFVKQANIAGGNPQVNNGPQPLARENEIPHSK